MSFCFLIQFVPVSHEGNSNEEYEVAGWKNNIRKNVLNVYCFYYCISNKNDYLVCKLSEHRTPY